MHDPELEKLVKSLPKAERMRLLAKIQSRTPQPRSKEVLRPVEGSITFNSPRVCISWKDALQHLHEVIIQNCDKKPVATIKAQVVEACATLAELCERDGDKRMILGKAVGVVMETDRIRLLNRLTNLTV